jgi:hypothetical protein
MIRNKISVSDGRIRLIKKGENVTLTSFIVFILMILINGYSSIDFSFLIYLCYVLCFAGIGYILFLRLALWYWKM